MIRRISNALAVIERASSVIAVAALLCLMSFVTLDVFMRYALNQPLGWVYDVTTIYLMIAIFYLALAPSFAANAHINVDLLQHALGTTARRVCLLIVDALSAIFFGFLALICAGRAHEEYIVNAYNGDWPVWSASAVVTLGSALLAARLVVYFIGHLSALFGGEDVFGLPPLAGETSPRELPE